MINDLDATLEAILNDATAPLELRNALISFQTPEQTFSPGQATVNLFLFDVMENRRRRDPEPIREYNAGMIQHRRPPLRVDCSYLVTTWSNQAGDLKIAEEHRLLSLALVWLSRFPEIPDAFLQGGLVGQPFPPPTMIAQTEGRQNTGDFWNALGIPPRPAFTAVVTLALELDVTMVEGPPVVTKELRFEQIDVPGSIQQVRFEIGGRIREVGSENPVPDAVVILQDGSRQWSATTDDDGLYTIAGLAAGNYTLTVNAAGFTSPPPQAITVPGTVLNSYDVNLSP